MSGNTIGKLFTLTTAGESHGKALVGILDGCPSNLELSEADIQPDLDLRKSPFNAGLEKNCHAELVSASHI